MQPGPGDYNHKNIVGKDGPGYSMKGRRPDVRVLPGKEGNGPGAYNPNFATKVKNPAYKMSSSPKGRVPDVYGTTPAPNNYNPNADPIKTRAATYGMGSGHRPPLS